MCEMTSRLDTLPPDLLDHVYLLLHRDHHMTVCRELTKLAREMCCYPLFITLAYEGFRPFNPAQYSGARAIGVYMHDCWEPYLICKWCNTQGGCTCYDYDDEEEESDEESDEEEEEAVVPLQVAVPVVRVRVAVKESEESLSDSDDPDDLDE